jgi:hypothetical protein
MARESIISPTYVTVHFFDYYQNKEIHTTEVVSRRKANKLPDD